MCLAGTCHYFTRPMANAHLFLFSDACPDDWLHDGEEDRWHTIVTFVHQSDPKLQPLVEQKQGHEEVLSQDGLYTTLVSRIEVELPFGSLWKWGKGCKRARKAGPDEVSKRTLSGCVSLSVCDRSAGIQTDYLSLLVSGEDVEGL
jgi:hypothetical protein